MGSYGVGDVVVDIREGGVSGVQGAGVVAFLDEGDGGWGKVGDKVLPATSRDVVSSCSQQSQSQEFFTRGAGRGERGRPEDFLGANRESIPVSPAEIGVGAVWGRRGWV